MRITDNTMEQLLIRSGVATAEQINNLKEQVVKLKKPLQELVLQNEIMTGEELAKAFSDYTQIPFVDLDVHDIQMDALEKIPERIARQYNAIIFKIDDDGTFNLAMDDPDDVQAINFIEKEIGTNTKIYVASLNDIQSALELYRSNVNEELNEVIDIQRADDIEEEAVSTQEIAEDSVVAQTVNLLLEYAIRSHASDVHIEPREKFVQVRYRIDGVLREVNRLPRNTLSSLVSRIKILSNLKIDERRVPQDGRFKIKVGSKGYALRVSTLPVADGEKVVMRILDESDQAVSLESLGLWGKSIVDIRSAIKEPHGMILITGPTGSGKSTSLFSILTILNTPEVNISTIEDPVEYKIPGVNQTQTNSKAGMTFANGLRALLRQDPNIIMIGEVRDVETADLAVQSALTGHLVLTTLHTNNAATCLPRLLDMNIEPFLIASTVKVVVGQRLTRRLNHKTRIEYTPTPAEQEMIIKMFNLKPGQDFKYIHELEKTAMAQGVGGDTPLGTSETGIVRLWKNNEKDDDNGALNGYIGRVGIYEVLANSENIQNLIVANATNTKIQEQAINEGMITMQADGLIKALRGETTIDELLRVTKE